MSTRTLFQQIAAAANELKEAANTVVTAGRVKVDIRDEAKIASNMADYKWLSTDTAPTLVASERGIGAEIDTATHEIAFKYWDGSEWQPLVNS